jgi:hypothetical protein
MQLDFDWRVIALRLFLTLFAIGLLGLNRYEHSGDALVRNGSRFAFWWRAIEFRHCRISVGFLLPVALKHDPRTAN